MSLPLHSITDVPLNKNTNKNYFFYSLTLHEYVSLVVIVKLTIHFKVLEYGSEAMISLRETWVTLILKDRSGHYETTAFFCVPLGKVLVFLFCFFFPHEVVLCSSLELLEFNK